MSIQRERSRRIGRPRGIALRRSASAQIACARPAAVVPMPARMVGRRVILVGGGARSGKSAHALALARGLGSRRVFIATARPCDDEMRARIARHVADRGDDFLTIEEPLEIPRLVGSLSGADVAVVDCLTLWLSNLLLDGCPPDAIEARVEALARAARAAPSHLVLVTNEVGMGIHPESQLGRIFRDLAGRAHQRLARAADEIHLAVLGVVLRIHPGPVVALVPGEGP
jgi:adenosylcobinamide kinase / adenosylcobinamide-phosphate guanylyltransferase